MKSGIQLLENAVDVHCHIIEAPITKALVDQCRTYVLFLMGTTRQDWKSVSASADSFPSKFVKFYGIHPWQSSRHILNDVLEAELRDLLLRYPESHVGEVGIDGIATDPESKIKYDSNLQWKIFMSQIEIASDLQRKVSIHSVQSHGSILDYFRKLDKDSKAKKAPPAIMMHSYSGSSEMCKALTKLKTIGNRFFFSYSSIVNSRSKKTLEVIRSTPDDRILVESDVHDIKLVDDAMMLAIEMVGKAKGWDLNKVVQQTARNAELFLQMK